MKRTILLLALILLYISSIAQNNCFLKKDEAGIKVYLCESENSSFKTLKVNFEAKGTLQEYANGVLDVNGYEKWQVSIDYVETLKQISETELIYYAEIETPWPFAHRDLIFHLKLVQDNLNNTLRVSLEQMPDYLPMKEGIVRIPTAKSLLTVTQISDNKLKVEYYLEVNPGGDIPAFIANIFAANTPWHTFYNFRRKLEANEFSNSMTLTIKNEQSLRTTNSY